MIKLQPSMRDVVGSMTLTSDGLVYDVALDWNVRTADWRATVTRRSDGATIVPYGRLSPGAPLVKFPSGTAVFVMGSTPYTYDALTRGTLTLWWLAASEVEAILSPNADEAVTSVSV